MDGRRTARWTAALAPAVVVLLLVAAWAIDAGAAGGQVVRNVSLAGDDIGGLSTDALVERIESIDRGQVDRPVRVVTPEVTYETTAGEIGLSVDTLATADAALDAGRTSFLAIRPFRWAWSFVRSREVELRYDVDAEAARIALRRMEGDALVSPSEPTIASTDGGPFEVVEGQPGTGIDPERLAVALAAAARGSAPDEPVEVFIQQTSLAPRLDSEVAEAAARAANAITARPFTITASAGDATSTVELSSQELRALAVVREADDSIEIFLPPDAVLAVLEEEFESLESQAQDASITVVDGEVVITESVPAFSCCDLDSAEMVSSTFAAGLDGISIELETVEADFSTADAEALGIIEEIGEPDEFGPTTEHACCENRVTNIHRMADIVRGAIIEPGETFSINDYVGRRTVEKGFVAGGVIYDGELTSDVGGGVSQFATGLFNAALFAGLEFGEYQSHSLYISRYPRGHEATISFPAPDLQIVNQTEYGVLIWPEYTATSLTVRLFSTRHIDVAVGNPTSRPQGNCTRWTTPRVRTYDDGSTEQDSVFALYRPREGVDC